MFNRRMLTPFDLASAERFSNSEGKSFRLTVRNAKGADPAEMCIFDQIGKSRDGSGIDAKDVGSFLSANRGKPVNVNIDSEGGLVFTGLSVYNSLLTHDAMVTTTVVGIAASIASVILQAGDVRKAFANSSVMIHKAQGGCFGCDTDMYDCGDWLKKMNNQLAGIYTARSGQSTSRILDLMTGVTDGSLFSADEAKSAGLIDVIIPNGGNGARNRTPINPSGVDRSVAEIRANAERSMRTARARRSKERLREIALV